MASLPCEACQEATTVIPGGIIIEYSSGALAYSRFRTCMTLGCDLYLIRRETLEQFLPVSPKLTVMTSDNLQLSKNGKFADRISPFPYHLVSQAFWEKLSELPDLSSNARRTIWLAAKHSFVDPSLVSREIQISPSKADKLLKKLWQLGILRKAARFALYELIPVKYLPANIRPSPDLQRNAS